MSGSDRKNSRSNRQSNTAFLDLSQKTFGDDVDAQEILLFGGNERKNNSDVTFDREVYSRAGSKSANTVKPSVKRKSKRKPSRGNQKVKLMVVLMYTVIGFVICSFLVARYVEIIQTDRELDQLEASIEELQLTVEQKQLEVSLKDDISMVQREAMDTLGMYYPKNDQIVYIHLGDEADESNRMGNDIIMNDDTSDMTEALE